MKIAAFIILAFTMPLQAQQLHSVRRLYPATASSKDSLKKLTAMLAGVTIAKPVLYCYKAGAEMVKAKYSLNPVNKFSYFKQGKTMMEEAVKHDPNNFEIRFLRLGIQTNLPAFLGYNQNIKADKDYLERHIKAQDDVELKAMAVKLLADMDKKKN